MTPNLAQDLIREVDNLEYVINNIKKVTISSKMDVTLIATAAYQLMKYEKELQEKVVDYLIEELEK